MTKHLPYYGFILLSALSLGIPAKAQTTRKNKRSLQDTTVTLDSVVIQDNRLKHLPDVSGTYLFAGKKTYDIVPASGKANLASSTIRNIFSTVPGVNVWEMSGNGFQMNIGSRGTDTHRSNEVNVRQNGYITNSDIFGYPEDHYTPQYYGVQNIQIVRGAAALQFGSQFGGMVNFKMKQGDTTKTLGIESEQQSAHNITLIHLTPQVEKATNGVIMATLPVEQAMAGEITRLLTDNGFTET